MTSTPSSPRARHVPRFYTTLLRAVQGVEEEAESKPTETHPPVVLKVQFRTPSEMILAVPDGEGERHDPCVGKNKGTNLKRKSMKAWQ